MASTEDSTRLASAMGEEKTAPAPSSSSSQDLTLGQVRDALIRQEDSIVFALIERAKFAYNGRAYDSAGESSFVVDYVKEAEALQAKVGRYQNPEEVPFFQNDLSVPPPIPYIFPKILHPASASVDLSDTIWNMYFQNLLPLITVNGDDGNYASSAAADLMCLQALSRRIHYGKFVAEVKFRDAPQEYTTVIQAKDADTLMKMLTSETVEEMVIRRVKKKAMAFGRNVILDDKDGDADTEYKVDPSVVARLYEEWLIPFTKQIEVEYLLRRLD